jgi:TetR/AcrR family transcriptional regulator
MASKRLTAEERREKIIRASMALFSEKGFTATTTKEIARAAGISESLIYSHFEDKLALYKAIIKYKMREAEPLFCGLNPAEIGDDRALFRIIVSNFVNYYSKDLDFMRLSLFSALQDQKLTRAYIEGPVKRFYDFLGGYIAKRVEEGALRPVDPGVAARSLVGMVIYFIQLRDIYHDQTVGEIEDEKLIEAIVDIFCRGLIKD